MMAPKELLPEELRKRLEEERRLKTMLPVERSEFKGGAGPLNSRGRVFKRL